MNIFDVMTGNLRRPPITLRFPERHPAPQGFRGLVRLDPDGCVGCGTCAYVCVSAAIRTADAGDAFDWTYEPGACTFCAACVDRCPVGALAMDAAPAPSYARPGDLRAAHHLTYPACPDCGRPARRYSEALLARAFPNTTLDESRRDWVALCERCRRRRQQRILAGGHDER